MMKLYDGTIIPANRDVGPPRSSAGSTAYHRPYHRAITARIAAMVAAGRAPALVAIHSFTPRLGAGRRGRGMSACSGTATGASPGR